ncbi:hypothetical protein BKA00_006366 [Actinomadura coerulea]|uniref:Uncharacterized protein n=1 Tax=Actinomadura coerulea TaxID=46159 RepID=A0A7X0L2E7_9ACTN|nr:hypothetical protein [Actinomadura coerulea]MBB6399452.1 hypothetical protein [Actinomadura coerulea]GGQ45512.1 hypothetical protein GCM10010187_74800 [Actinomadura coerulea]
MTQIENFEPDMEPFPHEYWVTVLGLVLQALNTAASVAMIFVTLRG